MDDLEAIGQLKARYFRTLDAKDWVGMRQVLSDDVVIDTTESGGGVVAGADGFLEFLQQTLANSVTVHQGHMPEIELDVAHHGNWYLGPERLDHLARWKPAPGLRPLSRDV